MKKEIKGYEGLYQVDTEGNVFSVRKSKGRRIRQLRPDPNSAGYLRVILYDANGNAKKHFIHRLVAQTFIKNPKNKDEVNHIDFNKTNNAVSNLEWCTHAENQMHNVKYKKMPSGEKHHASKLTLKQVKQIRLEYIKNSVKHSARIIAHKYNVNKSTILAIVNNKLWKVQNA